MACGALIDRSRTYSLCDGCLSELHWLSDSGTCAHCGRKLGSKYARTLCDNCDGAERVFDSAFSCLEYGNAEREMILSFKYNDRPYMARSLGRIMADRINCSEELISADYIVPVPSHRKKLRERGYNQAYLLAREIGKSLNIELLPQALIKLSHVDSMSNMGREKRLSFSQGNFAVNPSCREKLSGKKILLVDDILTTGSTAKSCTEALKGAGAERVYLATLASVPERMPYFKEGENGEKGA